jgi:hypothetical protein
LTLALVITFFEGMDNFGEAIELVVEFGTGIGDRKGDDFLEVDAVFLVEYADEGCLHLEVLVDEFLVERFTLVDGGLVGLKQTRPHTPHQPHDLFEGDHCCLVFCPNVGLLCVDGCECVACVGDLVLVLYDFVLDEGVVVLDALAGEDAVVVGEEVEVQVLHALDVPEDPRPVVVQVRLQFIRVAQVHPIIILSRIIIFRSD